MSLANAGILGAGDVATSCPSEDSASGDVWDLTLVLAEGRGDMEKWGWGMSFLSE